MGQGACGAEVGQAGPLRHFFLGRQVVFDPCVQNVYSHSALTF